MIWLASESEFTSFFEDPDGAVKFFTIIDSSKQNVTSCAAGWTNFPMCDQASRCFVVEEAPLPGNGKHADPSCEEGAYSKSE